MRMATSEVNGKNTGGKQTIVPLFPVLKSTIDTSAWILGLVSAKAELKSSTRGGGGGGSASLKVATHCLTTAPAFQGCQSFSFLRSHPNF